MGCDIHTYVERREPDGSWERVDCKAPFDWRSYSHFGFLADVRNYSAVPPISEPRGLPEGLSSRVEDEHAQWGVDAHSASWLYVRELLDFNYEQAVNDRRGTRQTGPQSWDGGVTGEPEEGTVMTFHEFLGEHFLGDVEMLKALGDPCAVRVVFWFDG